MSKRAADSLSKEGPTKRTKVDDTDAESSSSDDTASSGSVQIVLRKGPGKLATKSASKKAALKKAVGRVAKKTASKKPIAKKAATKKAAAKTATAKKAAAKKAATPKAATKKAPPVKDLFQPWTPPETEIPEPNQYWGIRPVMRHVDEDDEDSAMVPDPMPHPDQPSARLTNGATNPPLWEDLGAHFKPGRHQRYTTQTAPDDVDDSEETIDQEDNLQIRLIDMRVKGKGADKAPARQPVTYHYGEDQKDEDGVKGKLGKRPIDWNNTQALKCLNDRRQQVINRLTRPNNWEATERQYLADLFKEFPDASVWEITARWNSRFIGEAIDTHEGVGTQYVCRGRTVEDVRNEYVTYKPSYDAGKVPKGTRPKKNYSDEGLAATAEWEAKAEKFGLPVKGKKGKAAAVEDEPEEGAEEPEEGDDEHELHREQDEEEDSSDEEMDDMDPKQFAAYITKKQVELMDETTMALDEAEQTLTAVQVQMAELEDELLDLAGYKMAGEHKETVVYQTQTSSEALVNGVGERTTETTSETMTNGVGERVTESVVETVNADGTVDRESETRVEELSSPPKKRTASEAYKERMEQVDEDYADYDDEEL
ncbi:hypothetical protein NX059_000965 [Plenodomus lindquistii]|nr:hypothetical protein NX059_000965 [Plenodomus lindquistii]